MLFAASRDMQWRKRRLVITILSTGLIFGMTLVLTGLANGFRVDARHTIDSMGIDEFVVKTGAAGPFVGSIPFADVDLARIQAEPGVEAAAALGCVGTMMKEGKSTRNVTAFGANEYAELRAFAGVRAVRELPPPPARGKFLRWAISLAYRLPQLDRLRAPVTLVEFG